MNCPQCDADIGSKCVFCPKCGERLQGLEAECFAELREAVGSESVVAPQGPATAASLAPAMAESDHAVTSPSARHALSGTGPRLLLTTLVTLAILFAMAWGPWAGKGWPVAVAAIIFLWAYPLWLCAVRRRRAPIAPGKRAPNGG